MIWLVWILSVGTAGFLFVCLESIREQKSYRVTNYTVKHKKLRFSTKEQVIVFLSDLHSHVYGQHNDVLIEDIRRQKPNLILVGGDMMVGRKEPVSKETVSFLCRLPEIAPVYYANGNHEQRMKETKSYGDLYPSYKKKLMKAGVHFLENETEEMILDGQKIQITGLEIPMPAYEKFKKYVLNEEDIRKCLKEKITKKNYADTFRILLAHNPVYFKAYKKWGADLTLSGHLHGGIFRIPGFRGVITPQAFLFPKYSGEMTTEGEYTIIVSKGLGTHTVNFRVFNRPELVVVRLANLE